MIGSFFFDQTYFLQVFCRKHEAMKISRAQKQGFRGRFIFLSLLLSPGSILFCFSMRSSLTSLTIYIWLVILFFMGAFSTLHWSIRSYIYIYTHTHVHIYNMKWYACPHKKRYIISRKTTINDNVGKHTISCLYCHANDFNQHLT